MIYFSELCFYLNCVFGKLDWMNCRKKWGLISNGLFSYLTELWFKNVIWDYRCCQKISLPPVYVLTLSLLKLLRFFWSSGSWIRRNFSLGFGGSVHLGRMCSWCVGSPMWFDRNQRSALIWKESTDHEEVKLDMVVSAGCLLEVDQRGQGRLM